MMKLWFQASEMLFSLASNLQRTQLPGCVLESKNPSLLWESRPNGQSKKKQVKRAWSNSVSEQSNTGLGSLCKQIIYMTITNSIYGTKRWMGGCKMFFIQLSPVLMRFHFHDRFFVNRITHTSLFLQVISMRHQHCVISQGGNRDIL